MNKIPLPVEPRIQYLLDRKIRNQNLGRYAPRESGELIMALEAYFRHLGYTSITVDNLKRITGGASKEQFFFRLQCREFAEPKRFALRMDPYESIVETCRLREAQLLQQIAGVVPVPPVFAVDPDGQHLGQPALITEFVSGVTKPSARGSEGVSGIGFGLGDYAERLKLKFIDNLVAIHTWSDWNKKALSSFVIPKPATTEAALYQVGWWSAVWALDKVESYPLMTLVENWLIKHAPICDDPCVVHGDYRVGNFMFQEPSGDITAILDWEMTHFGDFHEDLAWIVQRLYGHFGDHGQFLVCGLMTKEELLQRYEEKSGKKVCKETLRYYEVLNAWKSAIMCLGTTITVGVNGSNHQDLLLTWLSGAGSIFTNYIIDLIRGE